MMQQQQQEIDPALIIRIVLIGQPGIWYNTDSDIANGYLLYPIRSCIHRTHSRATTTVTASTEREKEGVVMLLSFVYGSHRTIHYSSHPTYNTDSDMTFVYQVLRTNMIPSYRTISRITQ